MKTEIFNFELDDKYIALYPNEQRDNCSLLHIDRKKNKIDNYKFFDIVNILNRNDVLVLNNSAVYPAKIKAYTDDGKKRTLLMIEFNDRKQCRVLTKKAQRFNENEILFFDEQKNISAKIENIIDNSYMDIRFNENINIEEIFNEGIMPLPPYISKKREICKDDARWYQNVYAKDYGSIACPTAGLHFTNNLLEKIEAKGIKIVYITLQVSLGTFIPIRSESINEHIMQKEKYFIPQNTAQVINEAKKSNHKIIAVGTTVTRTLESAYKDNILKEGNDETDLFIYPGYNFKVIDGMITNFHTPKSTPYVMVNSLLGFQLTKEAYGIAINNDYKFYSYGDAMLIT